MTPRVHHRKSIRLKDYDYSQKGAYFVTICTYNRDLLFENEEAKRILEKEWLSTRDIRQNVVIDEFVVMPNHFRGIIVITHSVGAYCNTPLQNFDKENPERIAIDPLEKEMFGNQKLSKSTGRS